MIPMHHDTATVSISGEYGLWRDRKPLPLIYNILLVNAHSWPQVGPSRLGGVLKHPISRSVYCGLDETLKGVSTLRFCSSLEVFANQISPRDS